MKKFFLLTLSSLFFTALFAQDTIQPLKKKEPINLTGRANDHFLVQFGYTGWAGKPDSISPSGFSKSINVYFMFDFPFKSNPKLSMAFGPGISTDNIIFKNTHVGIADNASMISIRDAADTTHFRKTKLGTAYLEAPVEFRYTADPMNSDRSFKFALGVKVGTMLGAKTRNKDLQDGNGNTINAYVMKESSKRFFNTTRLSAHARVGWGHFTVYGSYQLTTLFKDAMGPEVRPFSIGLTLSGL